MPDQAVSTAINHWAPRMIQNGVDYNDFVRTVERVDTWAEWLPEWNRTADDQADLAREFDDSGHNLSAGHAWRRAATDRHFGKFVWTVEPELAREATIRSVQEMRQAHRRLDPTAERLEVSLEDGLEFANLRRPRGVDHAPYVVLVPGLDSTKEEFFYFEEGFLERGVATVSVDGPGQGETGLSIPIRHDYEVAVSALLDSLAARGDLDHDRAGIVGVSLGGYYAPRAAAFEPRVKAMVAISGPFCFADMWDELPSMTKQTFLARSGAADDDEGRRIASTLDLAGVCEKITAPSLYVTGKLDRLIPWQQTARQSAETPAGTFVNYDIGTHGVSNLPYRARPMIADWMADQLSR